MLHAFCTEKLVHGKADSYSAGIADGFFCIFDQFTEEAYAVFKRTAVFVGTVIVFG